MELLHRRAASSSDTHSTLSCPGGSSPLYDSTGSQSILPAWAFTSASALPQQWHEDGANIQLTPAILTRKASNQAAGRRQGSYCASAALHKPCAGTTPRGCTSDQEPGTPSQMDRILPTKNHSQIPARSDRRRDLEQTAGAMSSSETTSGSTKTPTAL